MPQRAKRFSGRWRQTALERQNGVVNERPKLIALLKDMENRSERDRRAGRVTYDFGWMWGELRLTRE